MLLVVAIERGKAVPLVCTDFQVPETPIEVDIGCEEGTLSAYATQLDPSAHFSGRKSDDPLSPDYVPSIFDYVCSPLKERGHRLSKITTGGKDQPLRE